MSESAVINKVIDIGEVVSNSEDLTPEESEGRTEVNGEIIAVH